MLRIPSQPQFTFNAIPLGSNFEHLNLQADKYLEGCYEKPRTPIAMAEGSQNTGIDLEKELTCSVSPLSFYH